MRRAEAPGWLTLLVMLVTAGATPWAMVYGDLGGFGDTTPSYPPAGVTAALTPSAAVVASLEKPSSQGAGAPPISAGSAPPHEDRGACAHCHVIDDGRRAPVLLVRSHLMPHRRGGPCLDCHRLTVGNTAGSRSSGWSSGALQVANSPTTTSTPRPASTAAEGEWLGMEVTVVTQRTASQYGAPLGSCRVVVSEVEAQASAAGVQAGDLLVAINGVPLSTMEDFLLVTRRGTLAQGTVDLLRGGERLGYVLAAIGPASTALPAVAQTSFPADTTVGAACPRAL